MRASHPRTTHRRRRRRSLLGAGSGRDGNSEVYVAADGSGVTNLTNNPSRDDSPAWSPDGTRIASPGGPSRASPQPDQR